MVGESLLRQYGVYAVCLIGFVWMWMLIRARLRGKGLSDSQAAERIPSLREQMEVRQNLQKLLVDLQDLARQINAHIDTRFCKLEVLIKEADEKIRQLQTLGGTPASGPSLPPADETVDPQHALVYKLADLGKSPVDIARELGKNTGEVELILSLRRTRRKDGAKIDYRIEG